MRKFENQVQLFKSKVYREVAKHAFNGDLLENIHDIPKEISPGPDSLFRCCIHHERAILSERIKMVTGGSSDIDGVIEVMPSACDHCSINRYIITEACRGCIAHRCISNCPVDAIEIKKNRAIIDYDKCVECGRCKDACPYNSIIDVKRPCMKECPTDAIKIDENKNAVIDYDKCISCGSCVYQCPFGAIQEKSQIIPVINHLKDKNTSIYAMLAPSFATQFDYVNLCKVVTGIKQLGFKDVVEVALGADLVTKHESEELLEKKAEGEVLTTSCCPGFVNYIDLKYPNLKKHISSTVSPMIATSRLIKKIDPEAKVVFIGPCIAKKTEQMKSKDTDYVLTFEELAALLEAKEIDLENIECSPLNNASYYGRKFAGSGGVSAAVLNYLKDKTDEEIKIEKCDGIKECDKALKLLKFNRFNKDFIEGMACKGGCIKGPVTMHFGPKDLKALESYSKAALEEDAENNLNIFKDLDISLE